MSEPLRFPEGFLWGSATAAHQVEGGNENNQWWAWEQQPGRIWHDDRSGMACDWWRNAERDLATAADLGQNAHRLSLEWSRIEPHDGEFDPAAIERYRRILSFMRERGIRPLVTLHHFTHPLWFDARGGWFHPDAVRRFDHYVAYTVGALSDLCDMWCTINEPTVYAMQGYLLGEWPPGARNPLQAFRVMATLLQAHAAAAATIHRIDPALRVGLAHHLRIMDPVNPRSADVGVAAAYDAIFNSIVLRALASGRLLPPLGVGQLVSGLRGSCDFFGLNYYTRDHVAFDRGGEGVLFARRFTPENLPRSDATHTGLPYGEIYPQGLYRSLKRVARYGLPILITEIGVPDDDDDQRPAFMLSHLAAVHRAIRDGIDVRGVFWWSLIDNFEWSEGWGLRFGLIALDHVSGERRVRRSGALYAAIARANALPADSR